MVQLRQQPHHDAQDPGVHDHSITFIRPAERGKQDIRFKPSLLLSTELSGSF